MKYFSTFFQAYVGFNSAFGISNNIAIATGKWGCGAFHGDAYLKTIIQLLAASEVGRHVVFFTFGDSPIRLQLEEMYAAIKDRKVGECAIFICILFLL